MNTQTNNSRFPFFQQIDQGINQLVNELFQHNRTCKQASESSHASGSDHGCDPRRSAAAEYSISVAGWELKDGYVLQFDVPGVALDDLEIQVQEGLLEVSGQRHVMATEDAVVTLDEQPTGNFRRRLRLAKGVDVSNVDAELNTGVLTVTLKKMIQSTPQKVQIRTAAVDASASQSAPTGSKSDSETDS